MITKDCIEEAYCFFHQKWRVYERSNIERQKEDIEYAISSYVDSMNPELYEHISQGKRHFLLDYTMFEQEMPLAIERLEHMM